MTYIITVALIALSALFSGLTLGLMSLDVYALKRKIKLGDKYAKKIYPIRKRGNLLLTALLLGNVAVNAALSIFLGSIASGVIAGLIATALIFLFGEIIPQAVISRHAMVFGAKTAWIVRLLIFVLYPIIWPIAWVLDKTLGHEMPSMFSRKELISVIEEHENSKHSDLRTDEERILKGALQFAQKKIVDVMTPHTVTEMLEYNQKFTKKLIKQLQSSPHSRFPVYKEDHNTIMGMLFLHELLGKTLVGKRVKDFTNKTVFFVNENEPLNKALDFFIKTHHHLFIVQNEFGVTTGVVSIEDILEEIIGLEIMDEFDRHADLRAVAKRSNKNKNKRRKTKK